MAQRESRLSRQIQNAIRARGWFCFKVHGSEKMMAGLPDIIVCAEGLFIGLETKLPEARDNVSPRQSFVHDQIRRAEGIAIVVCSAPEAIDRIDEAIKEHYGAHG